MVIRIKKKLYFLKCCECNKDITIYSNSPNKGFTCNNCIPKNCAARNGIDEADKLARRILGK